MKISELHTVGLVILKENQILLAYSKNKCAWFLPGGKIEEGESPINALIREIQEELNYTLDMNRLQFLRVNRAPALGEKEVVTMVQSCYLYDLKEDKLEPSQEIGAIQYFSLALYQKEKKQAQGVINIFNILFPSC